VQLALHDAAPHAGAQNKESSMTRWVIAVLVCFSVSLAAQETAKPSPQTQKPSASAGAQAADATFIREAAMDGMAEVEHGRLAETNAESADVKQFAQRMVTDHSKANDELKGLASQKNVTLPTALDQKHQAAHDRLAKLKGAAFDKAYMAHMVTAHQQAVSLFEKESKGGKDADAKAWAAKTLPTLQEHLKQAREVSAKAGKS
jgi:putative membrane protein